MADLCFLLLFLLDLRRRLHLLRLRLLASSFSGFSNRPATRDRTLRDQLRADAQHKTRQQGKGGHAKGGQLHGTPRLERSLSDGRVGVVDLGDPHHLVLHRHGEVGLQEFGGL